jgi:GTP-binding protein
LVAIVGRPNVGKSTLFNRISGRRKAITDSRPGSTRDRNYAQVSWAGSAFELVDTGGLLLSTDDALLGPAARQARRAIEEATLVLFVVDARAGILPDDAEIARQLRRQGKPVILVVNKTEAVEGAISEFARLGFEQAMAISAEHGTSVGDLLDMVRARLPRVDEPTIPEASLRVALVGRPNVGKSSLLNRLLGSERALVSPVPGTTRDAVDSVVVRADRRYLMVDTAGIRRARLLRENVDRIAVVQARRAIERAHVAVLLLDPLEGLREMDATIAGYVHHAGRGVVIAANKWDLARARSIKPAAFEREARAHLKFLAHAPFVPVSALTGEGLGRLFAAIDRVAIACRQRVTTGELNRLLGRAVKAYPPKAAKGGEPVRILFATQIGVEPPTFVLSLNRPVDLHFSYKRYIENQLRQEFGFEGTPLLIKVRTRRH